MRNVLTRRSFLKAAGVGAAGTALVGASMVAARQRQPGTSGEPAPAPGPNVVLVILDSLRKDHVGAYGNGWIRTPTLDALARESLRFTRAYPESMPTIPARRAIHTGFRTYPLWEHDETMDTGLFGWQPIPNDQTTLAEILSEAGYETMLVSDVSHFAKPAFNFHRGFNVFHFVRGQERDFYKPHWLTPQEKIDGSLLGGPKREHHESILRQYFANTTGRRGEEDWFAPQVYSTAMEFLEAASRGERPFFLVVDNYDPHEPWDPPEEYVKLYDDEPYDGPEPWTTLNSAGDWVTERQLRRMKAFYAGEVTLVDRWLGRFVDRMEKLGLMDNTLLVVLSDHGHGFREHEFIGKVSSELYPELVDIPFMIRHPEGKRAGETSDYFASTHDVTPTVLGALSLEPPVPSEGQDLMALFEDREPVARPYFTSGYHGSAWARDDRHVMFSEADGSRARLFDLIADPDQRNDLSAKHPERVREMLDAYVLEDAREFSRIRQA
jgi:arylsulfatase A-like enzyme